MISTKIITGGDWNKNLSLNQLKQALQYASIVGALTAQKQGVIPALPFTTEVEQFITEQNVQELLC